GKGFRPKRIKLGKARWLGFGFALGYLMLAVGLPYFALIQSSLRSHQYLADFSGLFDTSSFNVDSFRRVLGDRVFAQALKNSAILGVLTAVIGGTLHFVMAYLVYRTEAPGRRA